MDREIALFYLDGMAKDYAIAVDRHDVAKSMRLRRGMQELIKQTKLDVNLETVLTNAIIELTINLHKTRE